MIKKQTLKINNAPVLMFFKGTTQEASQNGTVFFFHGLMANKEVNEKELKSIADKGFLAIGIDIIGHGERSDDKFCEENINKDDPVWKIHFYNAIYKTALELPNIINGLHFMNITKGDKIGVCGISMGAYICYAACVKEPRIKAVSALLGSPVFEDDEEDSPHLFIDKFKDKAILSQTGMEDKVVPCGQAKEFHELLKQKFPENADNFEYIEYPNEGHTFSEHKWEQLWNINLAWFESRLKTLEENKIDAYTQITEKYKNN